MNFTFFQTQIDRLRSAFGDKGVNEEKTKLLWSKFKEVDPGMFTQVVDYLVLNQRQTPILDDFMREMNAAVARIGNCGRTPECQDCGSSGWIMPPEGTQNPVAMRCQCRGGPEALARVIRNGKNPDPKLADRILETFSGVSQEEYKKYGFALKDKRIGH